MFERIGVVLSDVDGTQLIHGQSLPSLEVQTAARALRAGGVPLLEVTGRSHPLLLKLVEPLDLRDNLCTLDGGATVAHANSGEVVWSEWLSASATREVVKALGQLCTNIHYDMDSRRRTASEVAADLEQLEAIAGAPSVFAVFDAAKGQEVAEALRCLAGIKHTPVMGYEDSTTLSCIQVVNAGVDKRYGIEKMLQYGGLADRRRLVIGDGTNDFPLFAAAGDDGIKVAMGNAPEELKGRADWVAPPVQKHGFVAAMVKYGLIDI